MSKADDLLIAEGLETMAQKLFKEIYTTLPDKADAAKRWVWELLQNAKDVIEADGVVKIEFQDHLLHFTHNGKPFERNNIAALLSQRSTKSPSYSDDQKLEFFERLLSGATIDEIEIAKFLGTSGRFGTGFMTTYLLSKVIDLEGTHVTPSGLKTFKLSLDREAKSSDEMREKVRISFDDFARMDDIGHNGEESNVAPISYAHDTTFKYALDPTGRTIAEIGIGDLHRAVPFVLTFVSKISKVIVQEADLLTKYERIGEVDPCKGLKITQIQKNDDAVLFEIATISMPYEAATIALSVSCLDGNKYRILPIEEDNPTQFISFPLVGSEAFRFPVVLHSPLFSPDDSRSHVFLNPSTSDQFNVKVNLNKKIFEQAVKLYKTLLQTAVELEWEDVHLLAFTPSPDIAIDQNWFKNSIQLEIRKSLLTSPIVTTELGASKISPIHAKFPLHEGPKLEAFWELCQPIFGEFMPQRKDAEAWREIISTNMDNWGDTHFAINLEDLLKAVQETTDLHSFANRYFKEDVDKAIEYLNLLINFTETEKLELLDREKDPYAIFPNQFDTSIFCTKKSLERNLQIPKILRDIFAEIDPEADWNKELVHDRISAFKGVTPRTTKLLSEAFSKRVDEFIQNKIPPEEIPALVQGMFKLANYASVLSSENAVAILAIASRIFPKDLDAVPTIIDFSEDFDWIPCHRLILHLTLSKVSNEFSNMNVLSQHLLGHPYPAQIENEMDSGIKFKTDSFVNSLIAFAQAFEGDKNRLLEKYAIIPDQRNDFHHLNQKIYNDVRDAERIDECLKNNEYIPDELLAIIADLDHEVRDTLLHRGISLKLSESRDLSWVCNELDNLVMQESIEERHAQPIRDLDKWISDNTNTKKAMDLLFKRFNSKRAGVVLNTYKREERDQFDTILKSGRSAELASIVRSGVSVESISQTVALSKQVDLGKVVEIFNSHPDLTLERIEILLELEALSKGLPSEVTYTPTQQQQILNFDTGWKGEAFVWKALLRRGLQCVWPNKSESETPNLIIDFEGERHYINDLGQKYDLVVHSQSGKKYFLQVKTTTTRLHDANEIALPITTREWMFINEVSLEEHFILARVFEINGEPSVYFMRLENIEGI